MHQHIANPHEIERLVGERKSFRDARANHEQVPRVGTTHPSEVRVSRLDAYRRAPESVAQRDEVATVPRTEIEHLRRRGDAEFRREVEEHVRSTRIQALVEHSADVVFVELLDLVAVERVDELTP